MPKYLFLLTVLFTVFYHAQVMSDSILNNETKLNKHFKNNQKPCEISIIYPENGANVPLNYYQGDHIIFMHWEKYISPEGYPINYSFEIWNTIDPSKPITINSSTNYKTIKVDQLLTNETYNWQVKAWDYYGVVCQSNIGFFKLTDSGGNACYSFIKVMNKCNDLISNASIIQKKDYINKLFIMPEQERIRTFGIINQSVEPYTIIISAPGYDSREVNVNQKENQTTSFVLEKINNLQKLVMTLKMISGIIMPQFCLYDIDVNQNQKCDLGDVIQMMKGVTQ